MKPPLLLIAVLATTAAVPLVLPGVKVTPIFTIEGAQVTSPVSTAAGQRIYYRADSNRIRMYDRRSRQHHDILVRVVSRVGISPQGDRLVFEGPAEDGPGRFIWTLPLDTRTGLASGPARRVSLKVGREAAFSTDGNSIAFVDRSNPDEDQLTVVPAIGGPERTLLQARSIWRINWVPGDQWITFGHTFYPPPEAARGWISRVNVAGGAPERVMRAAEGGAEPGLSPDGRVIITWDASWDSTVIATATGQRIAAYQDGQGEAPVSWIDGQRAMSVSNVRRQVAHIQPIAGGAARSVTDTNTIHTEPSWAPDSRRIATVSRARGLMVFDERGKGTRIKTSQDVWLGRGSTFWSPDGRSILYRSAAGSLALVNTATGEERALIPQTALAIPMRWTAGGRSLIYGVIDAAVAADSTRRLEMREVTIAGSDRLLRAVRSRCTARGILCIKYLNDSTIVSQDAGRFTLVSLRQPARDRVLYQRTPPDGPPIPAVSSNGRWLAVRQFTANGQRRSIELMATESADRMTLTLPFGVAAGEDNPRISDDGRELIVAGGSLSEGLTYYRVNVATGVPTKLVALPRDARQVTLSPDGTTLAYMTPFSSNRATVFEVDYSEMLKSAGTGRKP